MQCPKCDSRTTVKNTIYKKDFTIRYRTCNNKDCKFKFKTIERISYGWDERAILKKIKDIVMEVKL